MASDTTGGGTLPEALRENELQPTWLIFNHLDKWITQTRVDNGLAGPCLIRLVSQKSLHGRFCLLAKEHVQAAPRATWSRRGRSLWLA